MRDAVEFRKVAERHAVEHDVVNVGHRLSRQCRDHIDAKVTWIKTKLKQSSPQILVAG